MKKIDFKHTIYHVLIALYFIWLAVFAILVAMAAGNAISGSNPRLHGVFLIWLFLNLLMGTALFIVIRLFRNRTLLNRVILISYGFMAVASLATVLLVRSRA